MRRIFFIVAVACALAGCAGDLRDEDSGPEPEPAVDAGAGPGATEADATAPRGGPNVTHTDNDDGTTTTVVDASDYEAWIYVDLSSLLETTPEAPEATDEWDLGLQRFRIKTNGGISGAGGVEVAVVRGADFDSMVTAPSATYGTDAEDGPDEDMDPDLVFTTGDDAWYDYNPMNHVLTPRDHVDVVRSVEGDDYKLQIRGYYDDAGTSGFLELHWAQIAPPS